MISLLFLDFSRSFLFALATLLPILNPPAAAPIYLTLTHGASHRARAQLARKVSINIVIMLAVALVAGNMVLAFFGISLPVIRVGGGLLVVATAWSLVNASDPDTRHAQDMAEAYSYEEIRSKAFYPLTFPMIAGPGSLSAAITVGATLQHDTAVRSAFKLAGSLGGLAVAGVAVYFTLRFASEVIGRLGPNGMAVVMRLSAFLLLCLGVQIIWNGVHELILGLASEIQRS
jgi:multiple antibiotic resistance protein